MPINWGSVGEGAINTGVGAFMGVGQAQRQYHRQKKLNVQQYEHQRMLNQQGADLSMDMWNKTNYKAQMEHMKAAGLNPALMYGSAGQGGSTNVSGGGSAQGGAAAKETAMDMSNMMIAAQIEGLLAKAESDKADAEKTRGVDTEKVTQDIAESIARENNLSAEEELKIEQKLKVIQETTNLKTLDQWNKVKKGLDELKESKQVTGSAIVDLMTQVGLDPVNNDEDKAAVQVLLGLFYGSNVVKNIMQGIGGMKGNVSKHIGEKIINIQN